MNDVQVALILGVGIELMMGLAICLFILIKERR